MEFVEALNALKLRYELDSDYKLALFLDISRGRLANYRISNRRPADSLVIQVENLLELPPGSLLLDVHSQFAENAQVKSVYQVLKARLIDNKIPQALVFIESFIYGLDFMGVPACLHQCILCKIRITLNPQGVTIRKFTVLYVLFRFALKPRINDTYQPFLN